MFPSAVGLLVLKEEGKEKKRGDERVPIVRVGFVQQLRDKIFCVL